jgi:hypothetical protein
MVSKRAGPKVGIPHGTIARGFPFRSVAQDDDVADLNLRCTHNWTISSYVSGLRSR